MYKGIIYCAISPNNKKYYGLSTTSLDKRKIGHYNTAFKRNSSIYFSNALRKYGFDNFKWIIIEEIYDLCKEKLLEKLKEREIFYISKDRTNERLFGYNSTNGGDLGPNNESIEKIKNTNRKKWKDPEYRDKQYNTTHNKEFKEKFKKIMSELSANNSNSIKEKWKDPEYRDKMIKIRNSKKYRDRQSKNATKQWKNLEIREKTLISFKEKIWNNSDRNRKISEALKNKKEAN